MYERNNSKSSLRSNKGKMRIYNIQYRKEGKLLIKPVGATDLEEAKQKVIDSEGIKPNHILRDEALL